MYESRKSEYVGGRRSLGHERPEPGPSYPDVSVKRRDDTLAVAAHRRNLCTTTVVDERVIRTTTTTRTSPAFWVLDTIPVLIGALFVYPRPVCGSCRSTDAATFTGLAIAGSGGVALATDLGRNGTTISDDTQRVRVGSTDAAPCRQQGPAPARVEIILPDGASLAVPLDATGHGQVQIPATLWAREGGVLDADVRLDGVLVRRVRLEQEP